MGCTKCRQEQILKENKVNEIVYNKNTGRNLKTSSIIDNLHNIVDYNNVYTKKEILEEIELNQLEKTIQKLKTNKKLLNLLKKCQSRIIGMQYRKRVRFDNLRRSETLTLNNLLKKNIPISKEQIENFFMEYPAKISDSHIKIIKSDPIIFPNKIIYIGEWDTIFFQKYGRGIQIYPDNSYYKGYWENNKAHGKGEFLHSSGDKYIGYWKDLIKEFMKESLLIIPLKEKENIHGLMEINIKVILKIIKEKDSVFFILIMVKFIEEFGVKENWMVNLIYIILREIYGLKKKLK